MCAADATTGRKANDSLEAVELAIAATAMAIVAESSAVYDVVEGCTVESAELSASNVAMSGKMQGHSVAGVDEIAMPVVEGSRDKDGPGKDDVASSTFAAH